MRTKFRPSHADYTYKAKYGIRAWQGGGRASARETIGRVAAGAIARKVLAGARAASRSSPGSQRVADIAADRRRRHGRRAPRSTPTSSAARTPPHGRADDRAHRRGARKAGDSLGGVVARGRARRAAPAWASRCSTSSRPTSPRRCCRCPAAKGFEIGSGFAGTLLTGSEHNDPFYDAGRHASRTRTNRSGGVQGGISNGEDDLRARRVQADRDDPARAGDRRRGRPRHDHQGPRPPRSVRAAARGADRRGDGGAGARRSFACGSAASAGLNARGGPAIALAVRRLAAVAAADARACGRLLTLRGTSGAGRSPGGEPHAGPLHVHRARRGDVRLARQRRRPCASGRRTRRRAPSRRTGRRRCRSRRRVRGRRRSRTGWCPGPSTSTRSATRSGRRPLAFRAPPARGAAGFTFVAVGDIGASSGWPRGGGRAPRDRAGRSGVRARARRSDATPTSAARPTSIAISTT